MFYYNVPVAAPQSRTVLSVDTDASSLESGEKATKLTRPLCFLSVCSNASVVASQSRTVLFSDADASSFESGEKATSQCCPPKRLAKLTRDPHFGNEQIDFSVILNACFNHRDLEDRGIALEGLFLTIF
jgi:hypothetical protein